MGLIPFIKTPTIIYPLILKQTIMTVILIFDTPQVFLSKYAQK